MTPLCKPSGLSQNIRLGFTMIELLIGIGIIGVLSSIVVVAINPSSQYKSAKNAERSATIHAIERAIYHEKIANPSSTLIESLPEGKANQANICRTGQICNGVDLDVLISSENLRTNTGLMPVDDDETNLSITGYAVYRTGFHPIVVAKHAASANSSSSSSSSSSSQTSSSSTSFEFE